MANTASSHIRPCNVGTSEAHNRRTKEYLAHVKDCYIDLSLTHLNAEWVSPVQVGDCLQSHLEYQQRLVKEKTGRKMQMGTRERVDKKTGKVKKVNCSSSLREDVTLVKESTTLDDVIAYAKACEREFGIRPLQIYIHRDEGHKAPNPDHPDTWKPNLHAHIVYDWINPETGKSFKLSKEDMVRMQDLAAEYLQMERGESKTVTGAEHLERNDYINAKQKAENEQLKAENEQLVEEKEQLVGEKSQLTADIEQKRKEKDQENGNAILSGIADKLGFGEHKKTRQRNQELEQSVPAKIAELERRFDEEVKTEVEAQTAEYEEEIVSLKDENRQLRENDQRQKRQISKLKSDIQSEKAVVDAMITTAVNSATKKQQVEIASLERSNQWKDTLLSIIGDIYYRGMELFRKAIDAIVKFASWVGRGPGGEYYKSIFDNDDAKTIKQTMMSFGKTEAEQIAVGKFLVRYADQKADRPFTEGSFQNVEKEVEDVATGRYNRLIGLGQGGGIGR